MQVNEVFVEEKRASKANYVTWIGFITNLILTVFKLFAGIYGRSNAMIADAVHSLSDFATDIVVIVSFRIVKKPIDKEHDYGHGKFETLATAIIGIALFAVGVGILYNGSSNIYASCIKAKKIEQPGIIAFIAAFISIIIKEWLYRFTIKSGKEINSTAVIANAWHHRSDAFSSIGTLIGIGGAIILGEKWRILDPIAGVIVSFFILKVAYDISLNSFKELLEESLDDNIEQEILSIITTESGALNPHNLRTRKIGNNVAIEVHIRVKNHLSIVEAHNIAHAIEMKLKLKFGMQSFISIHTEPEI